MLAALGKVSAQYIRACEFPQKKMRNCLGSTSLLILFLFLSLSDSSCFVGFEFGVADFEVFEVFLGFCDDDACEAQEGNKVRDGHEAVDDICECPDGFEFQEGSGCEDDEEEDEE